MIHSVNACLAHSVCALLGILCMLVDLITPATWELLIAQLTDTEIMTQME